MRKGGPTISDSLSHLCTLHETHNLFQRRRRRVSDVIEEVPVRAELSHDGDRHVLLIWDADSDKADDVVMPQIAEESQLFEVVLRQMASDVCYGHFDVPIPAFVAGRSGTQRAQQSVTMAFNRAHGEGQSLHILESTTSNLLSLLQLVRCDLFVQ